jgi:hypothetical protein
MGARDDVAEAPYGRFQSLPDLGRVAAVALPRLRGRVRCGQERAHEAAWGRAFSAQGGAGGAHPRQLCSLCLTPVLKVQAALMLLQKPAMLVMQCPSALHDDEEVCHSYRVPRLHNHSRTMKNKDKGKLERRTW